MKRKISKYSFILLITVFCLLWITGCREKEAGETNGSNPPETEQDLNSGNKEEEGDQEEISSTEKPTESTAPDVTEEPSKVESIDKQSLPIYSINDETFECEATVALLPKDTKITAKVIVDAVVASLKEHNLEVGIDSLSTEGDKVIVSLMKDKEPLLHAGAGVEATILDCISQSLLDNLEDCKKVIFRIEGKAYESGHFVFEMDEAYSWK